MDRGKLLSRDLVGAFKENQSRSGRVQASIEKKKKKKKKRPGAISVCRRRLASSVSRG
jgi:hypothetical protein